MRLAICVLGTEVLAIDFTRKTVTGQPFVGDRTTYPVGFTRGDHE